MTGCYHFIIKDDNKKIDLFPFSYIIARQCERIN